MVHAPTLLDVHQHTTVALGTPVLEDCTIAGTVRGNSGLTTVPLRGFPGIAFDHCIHHIAENRTIALLLHSHTIVAQSPAGTAAVVVAVAAFGEEASEGPQTSVVAVAILCSHTRPDR